MDTVLSDWTCDNGAIVFSWIDGGLWAVGVDADTGRVGPSTRLRPGWCIAPSCS